MGVCQSIKRKEPKRTQSGEKIPKINTQSSLLLDQICTLTVISSTDISNKNLFCLIIKF